MGEHVISLEELARKIRGKDDLPGALVCFSTLSLASTITPNVSIESNDPTRYFSDLIERYPRVGAEENERFYSEIAEIKRRIAKSRGKLKKVAYKELHAKSLEMAVLNSRLLKGIIQRFSRIQNPQLIEDLLQIGFLALWRAALLYDNKLGAFSTYAEKCAQGRMKRYCEEELRSEYGIPYASINLLFLHWRKEQEWLQRFKAEHLEFTEQDSITATVLEELQRIEKRKQQKAGIDVPVVEPITVGTIKDTQRLLIEYHRLPFRERIEKKKYRDTLRLLMKRLKQAIHAVDSVSMDERPDAQVRDPETGDAGFVFATAPLELIPDDEVDIEREVFQRQLTHDIRQLFSELPLSNKHKRAAILLFGLDGRGTRTNREIRNELKVSSARIGQYINDVRRAIRLNYRFRNRLKSLYEEE